MKAIIQPCSLHGVIAAPPSKSVTQRAYAAALLHTGKTIIHNAGNSDDENAALDIIQQLGANVTHGSSVVTVESKGLKPVSGFINCGESGLAARLFAPIAAISNSEIKIEGKGSLLKRPMDGFRDAFTALGVALPGFNGHVPFAIQGPLRARSVRLNASGGSQLLSGLLFALSSCAKQPITINVTGLKSRPYIDLTLEVLAHFGRPVTHKFYREFYIDPALFAYNETIEINIEADWSSAAYMLVAGALAGSVTVQNLNLISKQADRAILELLKNAGVDMIINDDSITTKTSILQAFEFDATHCPDLFPIVSVLAACCSGESNIKGVHRLFNKESNRVESIADMLWDFQVPFLWRMIYSALLAQAIFKAPV